MVNREVSDDDQLGTRGDEYSDSITCLIFPALRLGFLLQTVSIALILCLYHGHGGSNAFTFDLYNFTDRLRTSSNFTLTIVLLLFAYASGTIALLAFQAFLTDSGK